MPPRKLTKLICTISDNNYNHEFVSNLYNSGMDTVRLNTAHQSPAITEKIINTIRGVSEKIAIMLDTKGAEMRTIGIKRDLVVGRNDIVKIVSPDNRMPEEPVLQINYGSFVDDVPEGTMIYIDEGYIELKVVEKNRDVLICRVIKGGTIKNKRSVNVPSINMSLPGLTSRDIEYVRLAIKHDVDYIAHSFVRNKQDVLNLQEIIDRENSAVKIIAKIENREGLDNFDEILQHAYGVLIARGDLGVEIPAENVPLVQKSIIRTCRKANKPVLIATHLLESMIKNPRPTQAEISDVANAVLDGVDGLVLTGETAEGKYPVESAQTISKICTRIESGIEHSSLANIKEQIANRDEFALNLDNYATVESPVKAVLCTRVNDHAVGLLSSDWKGLPVFVPCFSLRVLREFAVKYGFYGIHIEKEKQDQIAKIMYDTLLAERNLKAKDKIVVFKGTYGREKHKSEIICIADLPAVDF